MLQQLENRYSKASDNYIKFVDAKILDEIAGKELAIRYREMICFKTSRRNYIRDC